MIRGTMVFPTAPAFLVVLCPFMHISLKESAGVSVTRLTRYNLQDSRVTEVKAKASSSTLFIGRRNFTADGSAPSGNEYHSTCHS